MGQDFHVVRCFGCESFQVQQVKKVKKWSCKLCGQKQSLLKVRVKLIHQMNTSLIWGRGNIFTSEEFGRGSGPDCRRHVQKLNAARGALIDEQERRACSLWEEEQDNHVRQVKQVSRWTKYLNRPEEAEPEEQNTPVELESEKQDAGKTGLTDGRHGNTKNARKRHRSEESTDTYCPSAQPLPPAAGPIGSSRWECFLRADGQEEEPSVCGRSLSGAATKLRPQFPVCSMFESGEEFSFDDFL